MKITIILLIAFLLLPLVCYGDGETNIKIPLINSSGRRQVQSSKPVTVKGTLNIDIDPGPLPFSGTETEGLTAEYYLDDGNNSKLLYDSGKDPSTGTGFSFDTRHYTNGLYKLIVNAGTGSFTAIGIKWIKIQNGEENND